MDVLVIGGGIAGTVAAAVAAESGATVVLVRRGRTASAMSFGTIDLAPDIFARPGEASLAARDLAPRTTIGAHVERLLDHRPLHPYGVLRLRASQVTAAASFLVSAVGDDVLTWRGEDRPPFLLADACGTARAADLCAPEVAAGDLKGLRGTRVAVADFGRQLDGWDANFIAVALGELTGEPEAFTTVQLPVPGTADRRVDALGLAVLIDRDQGEALARATGSALGGRGFSHLLLPPACGIDSLRPALSKVGEAAGVIPFEILPAPPPSIPALRIQRALDTMAETAGVSMREGQCAGFEAEYGRVARVLVNGPDPDLRHVESEVVILCTGRYIGGGVRWERRPAESVFGLPVRVGESYPEDAPPSRFARDDPEGPQPVFGAGVTFGDDLRPLGPGGQVAYSNLYAAGSVLAGHDDGANRGGAGAALVTGWVAGRTATRAVASTS